MANPRLTLTREEVKRYLVDTLQHSCRVEYYACKLGINEPDAERPHDLIGEGNKFEERVLSRLALQFKQPEVDCHEYVYPGVELHRHGQRHHRKWNGKHLVKDATAYDLELGAVDTICALLEDRHYQGGTHSYRQIGEIILDNPLHKRLVLENVLGRMRKVLPPNFTAIVSPEDFPNIGLPEERYQQIREIARKAVAEANRRYAPAKKHTFSYSRK
jgi:hypothetical protein